MSHKTYIITGLSILGICLAGCSTTIQPTTPQNIKSTIAPILTIASKSLNIPNFAIVETTTEFKRNETSTNVDSSFEAFTADNSQRLLIEDLVSHQAYEIQGIPLSSRPFTNLVWQTNNVLIFDRWSTPHYGMRYTVDFLKKRLVSARPFTNAPATP